MRYWKHFFNHEIFKKVQYLYDIDYQKNLYDFFSLILIMAFTTVPHIVKKREYKSCICFCVLVCLTFQVQAQTIGVPDWAKRGGAWNTTADLVIDMATDEHGNVYVLSQNPGKINIDGHVAIMDSIGLLSLSSWDCDGNFRWMKNFSKGVSATEVPQIEVDTNEGIYLIGNMNSTDTVYFDTDTILTGKFRAFYLMKYNSAGVMQWFRTP